ncbi:nucleotidyltransferase family protein [Prauserella shujinwangii]|uniref:nucleotidyltransferase family protein n=1 Tax=Prauserella shujinwangii TaxID=1453103 RepID=UPI000D06D4FA|nr:nucleotidyltransferase family protein [Prauserella shujinwangii]
MDVDQEQLLRTVTKVTSILRASGIPFAIAGGCAVYAHGGPATEHDVDVLVTEDDAAAARQALVAEGMRAVDPPEDWLTKAYDGDRLVDLIYRPNQREVTHELLGRADERRIGPARAPVLPATDVLVDKLLVLEEHRCDFTPLLPIARALREQVDWSRVARETAASPYARAFLTLLAELGIVHARDLSGTLRAVPEGGTADVRPG